MKLRDQVAIVTGAARGLGRTYCSALARAGATVVAADVNACDETVADVARATGADDRAVAAHLDVTDIDSCRASVATAVEAFGRLDVLVNNAALYASLASGPFDTLDEGEWDAAMAVNVTGVWNMCRAAVPAMREVGGGSIINISSLAAVYGLPNALHYTTSKAAVLGITRGLARELGRDWIRVTAVAPSAVATEGTREFFGDDHERVLGAIAKQQALRRNLEPDDVAATIVHLAGDGTRFVTGQTFMVDGGAVTT